MTRILPFFRSPTGNAVLLVAFVLLAGTMVFRSNAGEGAHRGQLTPVASRTVNHPRETINRNSLPFRPVAMAKTVQQQGTEVVEPPAPRLSRTARHEGETKPRVLPISLFTAAANAPAQLSNTYAPYGRLVPCETVITIESSKLDTPVIGLVTEDIWHNGELVIPAGTEVHGKASLDRSRERIAASGKWVVVWRDASPLNGTELVLNGIALDRQKDDGNGEFGMRDGSAGLLGSLIKTDNFQEVKLFASTFLAGVAGGMQQLRNQGTAFGDVVQVPSVSGRNAALQGTADVLNAYARQIQEAITRDGFYVRVPAGKQFYLYVTETIDQAKGTRGNLSNEQVWRNQNEK